jgi:hypothetical protein
MLDRPTGRRIARCACGQCELVLTGAPIVTAACYCTSCQTAGERLEHLPGGHAVLEADGSTGYVLQRKDRTSCTTGGEVLKEFRLKPDSPTRRVVATCCGSPMFLEFSGGHWLSLYRDRLAPQDRPPIEMRTMTADRRAGVEFADTIPSYRKHSGRFMWRLLSAWAAMGFRAPKLDYVKGSIDG